MITTISLSKETDGKIRNLAKKMGQTKSSLIQQALRDFLQRKELEEVERKMQVRARAMGIETDDDVVALIQEVRKKGRR